MPVDFPEMPEVYDAIGSLVLVDARSMGKLADTLEARALTLGLVSTTSS